MHPVLIIIIPLDHRIPIQWCNGQEVAWLVLSAAWGLKFCPEIIATVPRDCIIQEVPGPHILDDANIAYPDESTDEFRDESLYMVPIQQQASIHTDVGIPAQAFAFPVLLELPVGGIATR
jgi:hypothetical protein